MKICQIPSSVGDGRSRQNLLSWLVNDSVAIDAGSLGILTPLDRQRLVRHVFLTHTHIDHIATLPVFLDNVYSTDERCPTIYGSAATLNCLQQHIFNNQVWPDFVALSDIAPPFLKLQEIQAGSPLQIEDLTITPLAVAHTVPTLSYLVSDRDGTVAMIADTNQPETVISAVHDLASLRAVFLECSFPNELDALARKSQHQTPQLFAKQIAQLPAHVEIYATHLKPAYDKHIQEELEALSDPRIRLLQPGITYEFA